MAYSPLMLCPRSQSIPIVTIWCLVSFWTFYGCLEIAEQLQLVPETGAEDVAGQDHDEDVLTSLASGLKSDVQRLEVLAQAAFSASLGAPQSILILQTSQLTPLVLHASARPLQPRLCLYRI